MNNSTEFPTAIKTFLNEDNSYAKSVIQSLGILDCMKNLINHENIKLLGEYSQFALTKEFFKIIFIINNIKKEPIIDDMINIFKQTYNKKRDIITSRNVLNKDPFHFLFFYYNFYIMK